MKLTTNYIVYLNEQGDVHCAKCRITGNFVKRAIAQAEYSLEYTYSTLELLLSVITMLVMYVTMIVTERLNKFNVYNDQYISENHVYTLENQINKAYLTSDWMTFKRLNNERLAQLNAEFN